MRYSEFAFPLDVAKTKGTATIRVTSRKWAKLLLPGWSFCTAGPLAVGLHYDCLPRPASNPGRPLRRRRRGLG